MVHFRVLVAAAEGSLDELDPMGFSRWYRSVMKITLSCVTVLKGNINREGLNSHIFHVFWEQSAATSISTSP